MLMLHKKLGVLMPRSPALLGSAGSGLPIFDYDFTTASLPSGVTLTRASTNGRRYNSSGVLVTETTDVARFDYDPVTLAIRGLLIEPAATNLLLRSSTFDNATWVKTAASVAADAIADPTGGTGADSLIENTANSAHLIQQSISFTSGQNYVLSVHAKANSRSRIRNNLPSAQFGGSNIQRQFNISTGEAVNAGNATASGIEAAGAGFWRPWIRHAAAATSSGSPSFWLCDDAAATSYTGDGTSNLRLWGAQLEIGLKPTSPIATTTASATRAADVCSFTIPAGVSSLVYTFDDNSTQTVTVSPGAYNIPTNLDRPHIKYIRGYA